MVQPFGQDLEDKKELNFLFLGSSWMASAIGQHHFVPNLLEQKVYQVNAGFCFGPGQNFEGHIKNNMGLPTQRQTDFVKQARAEKCFTEEKCQWFEDVPMSKKGTLDSAFMHVSGSDTGPRRFK